MIYKIIRLRVFFLSFHACVLPFFCGCLRYNRQLLFDLKLPFCACLASSSSKDHQQKKGAAFLYHGFSKEALGFLTFMNTSLATLWCVQDSLDAVVTTFSQTKRAWGSRTRLAKQWVGTAYHGSFALTLGNFPLQPSHRQLLPAERKACEQQLIFHWLPHWGSIPAHRWGNPRQAPSSSPCSPAIFSGCVIVSFHGSLTELSINQLNQNIICFIQTTKQLIMPVIWKQTVQIRFCYLFSYSPAHQL